MSLRKSALSLAFVILALPVGAGAQAPPSTPWRVESISDADFLGRTREEIQKRFPQNEQLLAAPRFEALQGGHLLQIYSLGGVDIESLGRCYHSRAELIGVDHQGWPNYIVFLDGRSVSVYHDDLNVRRDRIDPFETRAPLLPFEDGMDILLTRLNALYSPPSSVLRNAICEAPPMERAVVGASLVQGNPSKLSAGDVAWGVALAPITLPLYFLATQSLHEQDRQARRNMAWRAESERLRNLLALGGEAPGGPEAFAKASPEHVRWVPARQGHYGLLFLRSEPGQLYSASAIGVRDGRVEWRAPGLRIEVCVGENAKGPTRPAACGKNSIDDW